MLKPLLRLVILVVVESRPSLLLSSLHPVSRTGYGGQSQLLLGELKRHWHVQLLAWNLRHRGEPPAEDLEALLRRKGLSASEILGHANQDVRALLPGVPLVTSRIAPPTGHEEGRGWLEILRAFELFTTAQKECQQPKSCPFRKPDLILHLHDAWWLGPAPAELKAAKLPPMVAWLPILFDPLLSDDPERPDRSGAALEMFSGVVSMSIWGRGVYERALADLLRQEKPRWLPPLLGHVPHALSPAFTEGPLAYEPQARQELRALFGMPLTGFVVLLVGRNPPPPSSEANRKSHRAAIRAFARFKAHVEELCRAGPCAGEPQVHLHIHADLHGAVDLPSLLREANIEASNSREPLDPGLRAFLGSQPPVFLGHGTQVPVPRALAELV